MTTSTARSDYLALYGATLIQNGYTIIPIRKGSKAPGLEGWEEAKSTPETLKAWLATGHRSSGVGIVTKNNPAVDIDVLDEDFVEQMVAFVRDLVGDAPIRVGKAPKTLMLFQCDKPFEKVLSARYRDPDDSDPKQQKNGQRIEILGNGQQFVAYHVHPDTGRPYQWSFEDENPLEIPSIDLPTITVEQAREICREFERLCEDRGWTRLGGGSSHANDGPSADWDPLTEVEPPEENEEEIERVRSALKHLEEKSSDMDYEEWRNILFALKWTRWECAEELARTWSESSDKHEEKTFNIVWRGAQKKQRGREFTLGSLFYVAKEQGWDASRKSDEEEKAEEASKNLELILEEIDYLLPGDQTSLTRVMKMIVEADMPPASDSIALNAIRVQTKHALKVLRDELRHARKRFGADEKTTHAGYSKSILSTLEDETENAPVGVNGLLYTYNRRKGIWEGREPETLAVRIANSFDGQENCSRLTDYNAIARHTYNIAADGKEKFFEEAPVGLACEGRFYVVTKNGTIDRKPLEPSHRQTMLSPVRPNVQEMPLFKQFLHDTFKGPAEQEQIDLLQEVVGATLLGVMYRFEKAVLMHGAGRAGKGTLMKIMQAMMPPGTTTAVSPFVWDREYYVANLANKRANFVGELTEDEAIPAAAFKSVTGRDLQTGRHPGGRPISFVCTAAHIFNSNHYIYTKDHSDAFYARWILIGFRNSRIVYTEDEDETDDVTTDLAERIIEEELPGIMAWALKGAKRLLERGKFVTNPMQEVMFREWQKRTSSLLEFMFDADECRLTGRNEFTLRSSFYDAYSAWCRTTNRRPLGKQRLYDEFTTVSVMRLGIRFGKDGKGRDVVRGVVVKSQDYGVFADETDDEF